MPRLLTIDQKRIRVITSEQNLAYFKGNPKEFLRRFVTMDETWIYHYAPESREESKQWVKPGERATMRPKMQQSDGELMAIVFWDARGAIFIEYLEKGTRITGAYYAQCTISHTVHFAQAKKHELGFKSLPHPLYSPNLTPSDYYLLSNLMRWLCGRSFELNEEV